jgi:NADPH2:quinone reductase
MSQLSRAIVATDPEVLALQQREVRDPGAGEVVVEVAVSGVNPVDVHAIAGAFGPGTFPYVAGCEYSGRVVRVGSGVADFSVGDRVAAQPKPFMGDPGGWQDFTVVAADRLAPVPDELTDEIAGTVPLLALTALTLVRAADLTAGQRAVVPGAAGGVGRWLTQLLLADGVEVTTVTSATDAPEMSGWGATAVARDDTAAIAELGGFDAVLDVAGGDESAVAVRRGWLAPAARYLSVAVQGEGIEFFLVEWDADALKTLLQSVAEGRFRVSTAKLYPPESAADAMADFTERRQARTAIDLRVGR